MALPPRQERFVSEYLVDLNGTQAAIRAGYSPRTAEQLSYQLLQKPSVAAAVSAAQAARAQRTEITQDMVLTELWAIASADANDLIQWRIGACPSCWGAQEPEPEEELEPQPNGGALKRSRAVATAVTAEEPDPSCVACKGEGLGRPFVADTRTLTGAARKLYAGVKVTEKGIEVKMHDKAAALVNVGRHLGMFKDKIEHSGQVTLESLIQASASTGDKGDA